MRPSAIRSPDERYRESRAVPRFSGYNVWDAVRDGVVYSEDCPRGQFGPPELQGSIMDISAPLPPYQRQQPPTPAAVSPRPKAQFAPAQPPVRRAALQAVDPNVQTLQRELRKAEDDVRRLKRVVSVQDTVIKNLAGYNRLARGN
jgi:hypothetical protein